MLTATFRRWSHNNLHLSPSVQNCRRRRLLRSISSSSSSSSSTLLSHYVTQNHATSSRPTGNKHNVVSVSRVSSTGNMKFRIPICTALMATSSGASCSSGPSFVSSFSFLTTRTRTAVTSSSYTHAFRLYQSAAVIDDEAVQDEVLPPTTMTTTAPTTNTTDAGLPGQPIARGSIVRTFPGGLVAVRIDEDFAETIAFPTEGGVGAGDTQLGTPLSPLFPINSRSGTSKTNNDLGGDLMGRQVIFGDVGRDENGNSQLDGMVSGVVVVHRPPILFVYTNNDQDDNDQEVNGLMQATKEGTVTVLKNLYSVGVPRSIKLVDAFGKSTSSSRPPNEERSSSSRAIFAPIPQVKDIALINKPLVTGVTMFDALAPIGKGQNMLMIGHDADDMRRYVIGDVLKIQCSAGTKCVYAFTGDADAQATVSGLLEKTCLSDDVTLVSRKSQSTMQGKEEDDASAAAEATVVAGTACAIAETFALEDGEDVLVVVDTIDQHKKLWDATTRVLVDVFGVDSVVKSDRDGGASSEMRAFFSSLIQRSAQFKADRGGGSVTLLLLQSIPMLPSNGDDDSTVFTMDDFEGVPDKIRERLDLLIKKNIPLTAATLRKIQIPVPSVEEGRRRLALQHVDDLISMSDGQIWLDETLENAGRRPAFDFQRSVTRVGIGADTNSRADAPAMRRVVEGLRLVLSQAQSMDGAEVGTDASRKQMRNAAALLLAMHQPSGTGARKLSESCVALLAASTGALNGSIDSGIAVGSEDGTLLIRKLLDHVHALVPQAMQEIDTTQDFSDETKATISAAIQSFFDSESS